MLRQPEPLAGVSAVREGIKAVSRMALLKCGGIDGETGMDLLGWGEPRVWVHDGGSEGIAEIGSAGEAN